MNYIDRWINTHQFRKKLFYQEQIRKKNKNLIISAELVSVSRCFIGGGAMEFCYSQGRVQGSRRRNKR
jgi:hypothetical protein